MKTALLTLMSLATAHAQIDLDGDGLGDLWQKYYGLENVSPLADSDGDGMSNAAEEMAGTDPLDATSCFDLQGITMNAGGDATLQWDGVRGKSYFIQGSEVLDSWDSDSSLIISTGGAQSASVSGDGLLAKFWRVGVQDADQDGDGLTDFEEELLGFSPTDPTSTGGANGGSNPTTGGDLARAVTLLTSGASFSLGGVNVTGSRANTVEASRFLSQAAMGGSSTEIAALEGTTYEAWIEDQFTKPLSQMGPEIKARREADLDVFDNHKRHAWWRQFLLGEDILRHRIAFALSQILVISDAASLDAYGMSTYYDRLLEHSFGNYRDLLEAITLHPSMGEYLSHLKNRKADPSINRYPDENYAREVMQLFTIGLFELHPDGSRKKDSEGKDIPTYDNDDITQFARIFTGLSYGGPDNDTSSAGNFFWGKRDYEAPMKMWEQEHDTESKSLLSGTILPAFADDPGRTGMDDINDALDNLFNHPNVGPFIGRLLIQRLITSNPSPGYIQRVAMAFNNDGQGARGNMKAVIKAILLDPEARQVPTTPDAGRLREPFVCYARLGRIFEARSNSGSYLLDDWGVESQLGQRWMSSPSVFNFYLPDHQPNGVLADENLNGPEFQILTAVTAVTAQNFYRRKFQTASLNEPWRPDEEQVPFDWQTELDMTVDPNALINHLNTLIAAGQLSQEAIATIVTAVQGIAADRPDDRLTMAMRLIYLSPDFAVFR